jgi:hypothetical protein
MLVSFVGAMVVLPALIGFKHRFIKPLMSNKQEKKINK